MSDRADWFSEDPPRSPIEYALELARDPFWRDEQERLIGTHPDFPDVTYLLNLNEELAHGLILVLSRLPEEGRRGFAEVFFDERRGGAAEIPNREGTRLAAAASVVLGVLDLAFVPLRDVRIEDLLTGAAQGDDLSNTTLPTVVYLEKTIARVRFSSEIDDPANPHAAASLAIAEVLAPASEVVALKEVVARSCWAAVQIRESSRVLGFLLQVAHSLDPDELPSQ